jgi:hypothetical protein
MDRLFRRGLYVVALTMLAGLSSCSRSAARGEGSGSTQPTVSAVIDPSTGQAVASHCAVVDGVAR